MIRTQFEGEASKHILFVTLQCSQNQGATLHEVTQSDFNSPCLDKSFTDFKTHVRAAALKAYVRAEGCNLTLPLGGDGCGSKVK